MKCIHECLCMENKIILEDEQQSDLVCLQLLVLLRSLQLVSLQVDNKLDMALEARHEEVVAVLDNVLPMLLSVGHDMDDDDVRDDKHVVVVVQQKQLSWLVVLHSLQKEQLMLL